MAKRIPMRPISHFNYNLTDDEMDCITWVILSGCDRVESWVKFVLPKAKDIKKERVDATANDWWKLPNVRRYVADYKGTLEEALNPQKKDVARDREKAADDALNTFRDNVINAVNTDGITDVETLTDQATLLNRIGMLKNDEEVQVSPQRYLPERCNSCKYKQFIDEQLAIGNIVDE